MKVKVKNLKLECTDNVVLANNENYTIDFTFDSSWKNKAKTVRFITESFTKDVVIGIEDTCKIPGSVLLKPGFVTFGVYSDTQASGLGTITVDESILSIGPKGLPEDPPVSVYKQVTQHMANYAVLCNNILKECDKIRREINDRI